jgi:hypothetical protein
MADPPPEGFEDLLARLRRAFPGVTNGADSEAALRDAYDRRERGEPEPTFDPTEPIDTPEFQMRPFRPPRTVYLRVEPEGQEPIEVTRGMPASEREAWLKRLERALPDPPPGLAKGIAELRPVPLRERVSRLFRRR